MTLLTLFDSHTHVWVTRLGQLSEIDFFINRANDFVVRIDKARDFEVQI